MPNPLVELRSDPTVTSKIEAPDAPLSSMLSTPPARSAEPKQSATVLRHLTNNLQGFRLAGEVATSEWPMYLTEGQARSDLEFQVGYIAAVSVMPEASTLALTINDIVIGETFVRATSAVKTVRFKVPAGLVRVGLNSVRLTTELRHRVDCSIRATYELWTQIDPSQTGLVLPREDNGVTSLVDLAALPPDAQGALPIRAVVPDKTNAANLERILAAAQAISLVGRFEQPVVDVGPIAGGEYGINLVVGMHADVLKLFEPGTIDTNVRSGLEILPANALRRTTIVVTGATERDVSDALGLFVPSTEMRGTLAGLRGAAAFPGYRMEGAQRVKLRDLGVVSQEFNGRLFRLAFNIILPPDYFSADYSKATIRLSGGYAAGLTSEAQIVVSANGRNAVSVQLSKFSGDVFENNTIPLPLGYLRPGLNRIEIEAQLPVEDDKTCDPLLAVAGSKRFLLLDSTELELPPIARIARMPDLSVTATGGFPYAGSEIKRPKLVLPSPDRDTIAAAATITARMAVIAGRPINFQLVTSAAGKDGGAALVIGAFDTIDPQLMKNVGIDIDALRTVWVNRAIVARKESDPILPRYEQMARDRLMLQRNFPSACRASRLPDAVRVAALARAQDVDPIATASVANANLQPTRDLFGEWDRKVNGQSRVTAMVMNAFARTTEFVKSKSEGAFSWADNAFGGSPLGPVFSPTTSMVVAQGMSGESRNAVVTLITAPNAPMLVQAAGCLVDPRVWNQIAGRLSVLDASEGKISSIPVSKARLVVTAPLTISNMRLISAGWLSLNSETYVIGALVLALLLAGTTTLFVRSVGRGHR
ncbi:MAG: cellulose biosynthesis cyclic di-GMP-binding regulatory protein BcsB [Beijerinckiaceae bacterium]